MFLALSDANSWWLVQTSALDTNLRGVSVKYVSVEKRYVVWASGSRGVILRSTDEGSNWKLLSVESRGDLDFRDIEGIDQNIAYVMSSGDGDKSRIYKTMDGGTTWRLQYSDKRPGFFLDSLACDSPTRCVALSDPVDGKFLVLMTDDGEHWQEVPRDKMPPAVAGEGAFAASGTAITICGKNDIYFGTGGSRAARIFHSNDQGRSWSAADVPIAAGNASSGIFSVVCDGAGTVLAVGGDYQAPGNATKIAAYSLDSGATWKLAQQQPGGYRSAVGPFSHDGLVTVGTNGTDVSHDRGVHWQHSDALNLNAVSFAGTAGWAVGPEGTIARFQAHSIAK
jgi:photosystem II stability/assembly factor-like uncharacterized protein